MTTTSRKQEKLLTHCLATRFNDQMICGECGTQWDVNDPDKPECKFNLQQKLKNLRNDYQYCDRDERFDIQQKITDGNNKLRGLKVLADIKKTLK